MTKSGQFTIRSYRSSDREAVRRLCCQTGFLGKPIDPVYEDRELFADFLTTYYTDHEPESSFVIEMDGEMRGYLLGSRRPLLNQLYSFYQNVCLFLRALSAVTRATTRPRGGSFSGCSRTAGAKCRPRRGAPRIFTSISCPTRARCPPRARCSTRISVISTRCGEKQVYGQIVTFESRRGEKMFERYGFKVMNRAEITKYKAFYPESVYLSTVIKNLEVGKPFASIR